MNEVSIKIKTISNKLEKMHQQLDELRRENGLLKTENSDLKSKADDALRKSQSLQNEYKRLKLAKTLVGTTSDKAEMKFKVNELVREIDKCVALLNR